MCSRVNLNIIIYYLIYSKSKKNLSFVNEAFAGRCRLHYVMALHNSRMIPGGDALRNRSRFGDVILTGDLFVDTLEVVVSSCGHQLGFVRVLPVASVCAQFTSRRHFVRVERVELRSERILRRQVGFHARRGGRTARATPTVA